MSIMLSIYSRIDQFKFLPFAWFILTENPGPVQAEKDSSPTCIISTPAKVLSLKSTLLYISLFPFPTPRSI